MHILEQQAEIIGALHLGVLPTGNIDEMLGTLSPEEAHLTKRKFRKIKRKIMKEAGLTTMSYDGLQPGWMRRAVSDHCRKLGRKILNSEK